MDLLENNLQMVSSWSEIENRFSLVYEPRKKGLYFFMKQVAPNA